MQIIPIPTDLYAFRLSLRLDDSRYILAFRWESRPGQEGWYASVFAEDTDDPVIAGARVVVGWPLQISSRARSGPRGVLTVLDVSAKGAPLDFGSLGREHRLFYFPEGEVEAVFAQAREDARQDTITRIVKVGA